MEFRLSQDSRGRACCFYIKGEDKLIPLSPTQKHRWKQEDTEERNLPVKQERGAKGGTRSCRVSEGTRGSWATREGKCALRACTRLILSKSSSRKEN